MGIFKSRAGDGDVGGSQSESSDRSDPLCPSLIQYSFFFSFKIADHGIQIGVISGKMIFFSQLYLTNSLIIPGHTSGIADEVSKENICVRKISKAP